MSNSLGSLLVNNTSLVTLGLLTVAFLIHSFYVWSRLRHIPGPFWAGISKYWLVSRAAGGKMHVEFLKASEKYGPLVRIGPNELLCSDADTLRKIASARSRYTRSAFYNAMKFNPERDNLFSTRDEKAHAELKSKTAAGYSGREVPNLESAIDTQINSLISLIERKYISAGKLHKPLDLAPIVQYLTLDIIAAVAYGKPFGYLEREEDVYDFIRTTQENMPLMTVCALLPWTTKMLHSTVFKSFIPSEKDKLGFGRLMGGQISRVENELTEDRVAKEIITQRYDPDAKPQKDMLGSFITHGLTRDEASSEIILQVYRLFHLDLKTVLFKAHVSTRLAGSDTSATVIRATLLHIFTSHRTYTTLRSEIDTAINERKISSPITNAEAKTLPYLQAVILEGLRIFPPVAGIMSKTVPAGGDVILGMEVPAGTNIGVNMFGRTHSKEEFGADASIFRPERWLEFGYSGDEKERERRMKMVVLETFSSGKWMCPGNEVALIELNKVYVELLRRFDFGLENPMEPWSSVCAGVFLQKNMLVRVTEREVS